MPSYVVKCSYLEEGTRIAEDFRVMAKSGKGAREKIKEKLTRWGKTEIKVKGVYSR